MSTPKTTAAATTTTTTTFGAGTLKCKTKTPTDFA
jgi:hypothetical protein